MSDDSKLNRSVVLQLWAIGALVPLALILTGEVGRYDFAAFWIAGKQAWLGEAANIYELAATKVHADALNLGGATVFPYPPHALFFFMPFALLPYIPAYIAWNITTAAFFYWAAKPYLPRGFPPVLTIVSPAALSCLDFGQTGLLFGGLWFLAFGGRWVAVALLTFKPHLGLLSILSLKNRSTLLRTIALALALIVASAFVFGPSLWARFAEHTLHHASEIGMRKRWLFAGVSPAIGYGMLGWIPFAVAGGLLLARNVNVFTAATASILISPYGFHYDMPVACLGFGLSISVNWDRMPISHRLPMALGFLSPVIAISGAWWVPPILLWALWAQTKYEVSGAGRPLQPVF